MTITEANQEIQNTVGSPHETTLTHNLYTLKSGVQIEQYAIIVNGVVAVGDNWADVVSEIKESLLIKK